MTREIKTGLEKTNELRRQIERLEFERDELKVKQSSYGDTVLQEKMLRDENGELKRSVKQTETSLKISKEQVTELQSLLSRSEARNTELNERVK